MSEVQETKTSKVFVLMLKLESGMPASAVMTCATEDEEEIKKTVARCNSTAAKGSVFSYGTLQIIHGDYIQGVTEAGKAKGYRACVNM